MKTPESFCVDKYHKTALYITTCSVLTVLWHSIAVRNNTESVVKELKQIQGQTIDLETSFHSSIENTEKIQMLCDSFSVKLNKYKRYNR